MAKPNRFDVAGKVDELSPATKETVADALGVDPDAEQLATAFEGASKHGLIEEESGGGWLLTDKGRERLAEKADDS